MSDDVCPDCKMKWDDFNHIPDEGCYREKIGDLRQRLAAAEKERDESQRREVDVTRRLLDLEVKLSLYESAPSEPEVKWALEKVRIYGDRMFPTGEDRAALCHASTVLARALLDCQAKLAEVRGREDELMKSITNERTIALKAESELAAAQRVIEAARTGDNHCTTYARSPRLPQDGTKCGVCLECSIVALDAQRKEK